MPISKKDRISREHKKADAAGTRVPVNPNGTPKKPPKAMSICVFCKKELVSTTTSFGTAAILRDNTDNVLLQASSNLKILEQHASTHSDEWTKEKCWPQDFK